MTIHPELEQALQFATTAHRGQTRKDTDEPYIIHCIRVKEILEETGVQNLDILRAAILKDVLEDCGVQGIELNELFGENVMELVCDISDDPTMDQNTPHREQTACIEYIREETVMIKMAVRIDNLREFGASLSLSSNCKCKTARIHSYVQYSRKLLEAIILRTAHVTNKNRDSWCKLLIKLTEQVIHLSVEVARAEVTDSS